MVRDRHRHRPREAFTERMVDLLRKDDHPIVVVGREDGDAGWIDVMQPRSYLKKGLTLWRPR